MKIIIAGAGRIGSGIAQSLEAEGHDITVIDRDAATIESVSNSLDVICMLGSATNPDTLRESGAAGADILMAMTESDEVNMICALAAKRLGAKNIIARVRNPEYLSQTEFLRDAIGLSMLVNPEYECAKEISRILRFPGAVRVDTFSKGSAEIIDCRIPEGSAVYLDNGSTTVEIADALLGKQNIAVLSHSLPVLNILSNAKNIQLISIPGVYEPSAKGFFGDLAVRMIRQFRIDIAFFGVTAVSAEDGVMSAVFYEQALKKALLERARKKVLAIDHTKIGGTSFLKVCDLKDVDVIVTDHAADRAFLKEAARLGVETVQV